MSSNALRLLSLSLTFAMIAMWVEVAHAENDPPAVKAAKAELEAAVQKAVDAYVAKLEAAAKESAAQGDLDTAKSIDEQKKAMQQHGLSTTPDPTSKAKRILLANLFYKSDGAILDFRSDYTAFGRHNKRTTNWVMPDAQTLIMGATDPTRPLYIWKLDKSLSRGVVYKYNPATGGKRVTARRGGR